MPAGVPWWQTTRTLRQGYVMVGISAVLMVLSWARVLFFDGQSLWVTVFALFWTLFAALHVNSALQLHLRR